MRSALRDRDAVVMGLVVVLFLHLLFFALLPREAPRVVHVEMPKPERIIVKLLPPPNEEPEAHYLRANPEAPVEAPPPDVLDYSNRDQVAAQEEVTPLAEDNMPAQRGDEADSVRLVQGSPFQPPPTPNQAYQSQQQPATSPVPAQMPAPRQHPQITPPDAMERTPVEEDGLFALEDPGENPEKPEEIDPADDLQPVEVTSNLDGRGEAENFTPPQQATPPSPQQTREPRPQPRLQRDNSYGPLRDSALGVSRSGNLAWNTRYMEFGEYWNRLIEIIELRWNDLVSNSYGAITPNHERVVFEFTIHRDGSISDVTIVSSGVGRVEETLASDAIQSRAPFAPWTPDMIATVGESTSFTLGFIY